MKQFKKRKIIRNEIWAGSGDEEGWYYENEQELPPGAKVLTREQADKLCDLKAVYVHAKYEGVAYRTAKARAAFMEYMDELFGEGEP